MRCDYIAYRSIANTCKKDSHLGIKKDNMPHIDDFCNGQIEGLHLHTMCEQNSDTLERTIEYIIKNYDKYLKKIKWINLGGGQLLGASNYDVSKAIDSIKKIKNNYDIIVGCSCYAGDTFGIYYLNKKLKIGDNIIFKDVASYTMVKSNMFNGIPFPNLYIIDLNKNIQKIKEYDYNIFRMIL